MFDTVKQSAATWPTPPPLA